LTDSLISAAAKALFVVGLSLLLISLAAQTAAVRIEYQWGPSVTVYLPAGLAAFVLYLLLRERRGAPGTKLPKIPKLPKFKLPKFKVP
jgi:hypothetical protein